MSIPLSVLDLATVSSQQSVADSLAGSVTLAQQAERLGYHRVWYAEHHNMPGIASSATSVLIAHIAANTTSIRVGAGGVMLPNHAPLIVAEHYGTLAELHPDRIDLGLGRAPGTDQNTMRALRRDIRAADTFPHDVLELQGYLAGDSRIPGVNAYPGHGTFVPLYILGSSLFGAKLAAQLGLPYAFASHFAPAALPEALAVYRNEFQPSDDHAKPYAIVAVNAIGAHSAEEAEERLRKTLRARLRLLVPGARTLSRQELDLLMDSPAGHQAARMLSYSAVGTVEQVREFLTRVQAETDADEIIVAHQGPGIEAQLESLEVTAEAWGLTP